MMNDVRCPDCHGDKFIKHGKTRAGHQKYRCCDPGCGRRFVAGPTRRIPIENKRIILSLLAGGVEPLKIFQALPDGRVSLRWLYEMRRRVTTPIVHKHEGDR